MNKYETEIMLNDLAYDIRTQNEKWWRDAGGLGLDIGGALVEKLEFNKTRLDHTAKHRLQDNGKKY